MSYVKEEFDSLFESLKLGYLREYDSENLTSKVVAMSLASDVKGEGFLRAAKGVGTSKAHKDDIEFATELVGTNIAEIRANIDYLEKMLKHDLFRDKRELIKGGIKDLEETLEAYIDTKDKFYRKLESNRTKGGYEPARFEDLGDLLKNVPLEERAKIFADIQQGMKEEQARIAENFENLKPEGETNNG